MRPRPSSAPRQAAKRKPPVLGSIAATSDEATVVLSKRAMERLAQGHVWIYRSDIAAPDALAGGEIVRLTDERGWFAGKAFYGSISQIAVRLLTREDEPVDEGFLVQRLWQAIALREAARKRGEKSMGQRLAAELTEAAEGRGGAVLAPARALDLGGPPYDIRSAQLSGGELHGKAGRRLDPRQARRGARGAARFAPAR